MSFGVTAIQVRNRTQLINNDSLSDAQIDEFINISQSTVQVTLEQFGIEINADLEGIEESKRDALRELVILQTLIKIYNRYGQIEKATMYLNEYRYMIDAIKIDPEVLRTEGADSNDGTTYVQGVCIDDG